MSDYPKYLEEMSKSLAALGQGIPEVMQQFQALNKAGSKDGVLDNKTKELIALAIGVATKCKGCIAYHAQALLKLGATRQEILETLGVAVYMGGGPSVMYAAEALKAFDELSEGK